MFSLHPLFGMSQKRICLFVSASLRFQPVRTRAFVYRQNHECDTCWLELDQKDLYTMRMNQYNLINRLIIYEAVTIARLYMNRQRGKYKGGLERRLIIYDTLQHY